MKLSVLFYILIFTLFSCENENSNSNELDPEEVKLKVNKSEISITELPEHMFNTYQILITMKILPTVINFHGNGGMLKPTLILQAIYGFAMFLIGKLWYLSSR